MMDDTSHIDRVITVAAGTGTWWYNATPTKRIAWFLWYFLVPATVPFFGYFPGSKIKVMCDLPRGVMWQWRKWCLTEDYAIEAEGDYLRERFAQFDKPMTVISFSDDEVMSAKNIERLHSFFSGTSKKMMRIHPRDIEQKRIGHIGWHKSRYQSLWELYFLPE